MQNLNAIHILPHPRTIPKAVIWTIYVITTICLIAAIASIVKSEEKKSSSKEKEKDEGKQQEQTMKPSFEARMTLQAFDAVQPEHHTLASDSREPPGDTLMWQPRFEQDSGKATSKRCDDSECDCGECQCAKEDITQRFGPNEVDDGLNLLTLEEIVAYESWHRPRIRNLSWFEDSSDEVIDWVSPKEVSITNVEEMSTLRGKERNCNALADNKQHVHNETSRNEGKKEGKKEGKQEGKKEGKTEGKREGKKEEKKEAEKQEQFGGERRERPRRHVATLHGCLGEKARSKDMQCRFVVRVLSTMLDGVKVKFAKNLATQFRTVARDRPGVYGFGHEVPSSPREIKQHVHRCRYLIRIPLNNSDTTCVLKAQEEYEYLWNLERGVNRPKYTITTTESCPNYELIWTDEYEFDSPRQANLHLVYQLTSDFFKWPPNSYWRPKRNEKKIIRNKKTSRCAFEGSVDAGASATDCGLSWRPQRRGARNTRTACASDASAQAKFDCQFSNLIGRATFVEKALIEYERIGKTNWIVHTISQWNEELESSILSLAVSNDTELLEDLKESRRLDIGYQWIPVAGKEYRPLVANDIYVTHLVAIKGISEEELSVYYIGAPVANLSRRMFYRTKIDVSHLKDTSHKLEPSECMTCPSSPNEGGREVSGVDRRPQCIYSEVLMSKTREKYILKCWGPDFPWVSVVATCSNLVTSQLEMMLEQRKLLGSKVQPTRRDYSSFVGGAVRVHLPPDLIDESGRCRRRPRLLLLINDVMFDQSVDAEYDLSLATYLASVKGFAVLYVDPRVNFINAVDASKMKMYERESEQMTEYLRMVHEAVKLNPCLAMCKGFGLLGENYGGHLVLNLIADEWRSSNVRCSAAVRPFAPWQRYVYPFHPELSEYTGNPKLEKKPRRDASPFEGYMEQLVSQLPGKNLFLYVGSPSDPQLKPYASLLQSLAERYELSMHYHDNGHKTDYESKLKLYEALIKYFEDCFAN